jgi:glucosamine--fructose-6-phosphate aminotransferase (isomerizing)
MSGVAVIGAAINVGVVATKTFLDQLLAFYVLAIAFTAWRVGQQVGGATNTRKRLQALTSRLKPVPEQLRELVEEHDWPSEVLLHWSESKKGVIFLGRGSITKLPSECTEALAEGFCQAVGDQLHPRRGLSGGRDEKWPHCPARCEGAGRGNHDAVRHVVPMPVVDDLLSPLFTVVRKQLLGRHIPSCRGAGCGSAAPLRNEAQL